MSDADGARKVAELVEQAELCMFTTHTDDGRLVSRPMALQEAEFDGDLWFFAKSDSPTVEQISADPRVNVGFSNPKQSEWISVTGNAYPIRDRAKAEELWSAALNVWFPDGLDTPELMLIKVSADSAEYWDSPSGTVKKLVGAARAAAKDDPNEFPGDREEVSL